MNTVKQETTTTVGRTIVKINCPAAMWLWDQEKADLFRQTIGEATGRDCLCQEGEPCRFLEAVNHLGARLAQRSAERKMAKDLSTEPTLRAMREEAGMSLRALAEGAKCSHQHLSYIEAGKRTLSHDLEQRVAVAIANHVNRPAMA